MDGNAHTVKLRLDSGFSRIVLALCMLLFLLLLLPSSALASTRDFPISGTQDYVAAYQMLSLLNTERARVGKPALRMDTAMMNTAMQRAAETTVSFSHTRPNGQHWSTLLPSGNTWWGENLAVGQATPADAMKGLMNSSGHRANIVHDRFTCVGIGVFEHNGSRYWTQIFGNKRADSPSRPANKAVTYPVSIVRANARVSIYEQVLSPTSTQYSLRVGTSNAWKPAVVNSSATLFTSSNTSVATINNSGVLNMGSSAGSTSIRAALRTDTALSASTNYRVYTVTFNSAGGSAVPRRLIASTSGLGSLPIPTRDGFSFAGWFTAASGGTQVDATTRFTSNVTLFARWQQKSADHQSPSGQIPPQQTVPGVKQAPSKTPSQTQNPAVSVPSQKLPVPAPPASNKTPAAAPKTNQSKPAAPKSAPQRIDASVKTIRMRPGKTLKVPIVVRGKTNQTTPISWKTSKRSVVTIKEGKSSGTLNIKQNSPRNLTFTAGKAGSAEVVLTAENSKKIVFRIEVRKNNRRLERVRIGNLPKNRSMKKGASRNLSAKLTPKNATLSGKVQWTSSKPKIASIDQAGRITAHKKGETTITLRVASQTHKVKIRVR